MISTSTLDRSSVATDLPMVPPTWAGHDDRSNDHAWAIRRMRPADVPAVKALFRSLHAFNASLDQRFALSEEWEHHFYAAMQQVLRSDESVCLIACESGTDRPQGFALAALHRDSGMWRCREWVEVEALYVEDACRGHGLAEMLLDGACDWAEGIGQSVVQLYVTASNERAIRFYHHEGFGESQAIMRKVLA